MCEETGRLKIQISYGYMLTRCAVRSLRQFGARCGDTQRVQVSWVVEGIPVFV